VSRRRGWALAIAAASLTLLAACAPLSRPPAGTPVPAASGAGSTSSAGLGAGRPIEPVPAVIDSSPSPEALRVLANIPEPLAPAEQALNPRPQAPPASATSPAAASDTLRGHRTVVAPEAASDTLRVVRTPENEPSSVPVPAPTQPLGSQPGVAMPETLSSSAPATTGASETGAPSTATPASAPATPASPPTAATGGKEPCWRLQVAAKVERADAEIRLEAAQSQLVIPLAIVTEKGYFKVRTRDCLTREAADALKKRAIESGFADVFLVDTNAPPPKPASRPTQHRRVPASRRKQ